MMLSMLMGGLGKYSNQCWHQVTVTTITRVSQCCFGTIFLAMFGRIE